MMEPCRLLIVDDSPTQLAQMKMLLASSEFEVLTARDGQEAFEIFLDQHPDIVITDLQMPRVNGLELVALLKRNAPAVPVILTTGTGSEEIAAEALIKGAVSYVPKSVIQTSLLDTVRQVLAVTQAASSAENVSDCMSQLKLEFQLPNLDTLIPSVIGRLEAGLQELGLFDEMEWTQIAMALDEAMLNAMIHGNLQVSSKLREVDDGKPYMAQVRERQTESPYRERRVLVALTATRAQAVVVIRDEGPGFDVTSLPDPTDPANLENMSGRGLLLINAFMDEVKHNSTGNEITMLKRKAPSGEPGSEDSETGDIAIEGNDGGESAGE